MILNITKAQIIAPTVAKYPAEGFVRRLCGGVLRMAGPKLN